MSKLFSQNDCIAGLAAGVSLHSSKEKSAVRPRDHEHLGISATISPLTLPLNTWQRAKRSTDSSSAASWLSREREVLGERGQHPQAPSLYRLLLYQIQFAGTVSVRWQRPMSLRHKSGLPNAGAPPFLPSTPDSVNVLCT